MFTTGVERRDADTRIWYGEPQHEVGSEIPWEAAYYGGKEEEEEAVKTEFVSGIERPADYGPELGSADRGWAFRQSAD